MADKLAGGIKSGAISVSVNFLLTKTVDGTEQTGRVAADLTISYWRQGGVRAAITPVDLAAVDSAYASGGVKEVDAANQPGLYRLDLPNAAVAAGADWVVISVKSADCFVYHERFALESVGAAEVATLVAAVPASTRAGITSDHGTGSYVDSGGGGGGGGLGSGARPVAVLVQDTDLDPIPYAVVSVYNEALTGDPIVGPWPTDGAGKITFLLDDATYNFVVRSDPHYAPADVQEFEVDGIPDDPAVTFTLSAFDPGTPLAPDSCRVYGWLYLPSGEPAARSSISFYPNASGVLESSRGFVAKARHVETKANAAGYFFADLVRSSALDPETLYDSVLYRAVCEDCGLDAPFTVPDAASANLKNLLP